VVSYPITLPSSPKPSITILSGEGATESSESPYNGDEQIQHYPAERLTAEINYPPMLLAEAEDLLGTLLALYGSFGTFYLGSYVGRSPRGPAGGTPVVSGAGQTGRQLFTSGWTPSTLPLKLGDWLQYGAGYRATRIQTTGGTDQTKYYFDIGLSTNAVKYRCALRLKNRGAATVVVINNLGLSQAIASGAEAAVEMIGTGNGTGDTQINLRTTNVGDAMDVIAWDPVIQHYGINENLIPSDKLDFSGWSNYLGAVVTLTQNFTQRLQKVVYPAPVADADGKAIVHLFPGLRESPIDGEALVLVNTAGVWRLEDDVTTWTIDQAIQYGLKFKAREAR
jgi:hypothetical protein